MSLSNKILIIRPVHGLCNQINSLVKGILLAYHTNRNLYIDQFQIDCNHIEKRSNIDQIYDLQQLQTIIDFLKLNVKILENIDINDNSIIKKLNIQHDDDYNSINIENYLKYNEKESILDIENLSLFFAIEKHNLEDMYEQLRVNIPFHNKYVELAEKIKETFHLQNYVCVHLRFRRRLL